MKNTAAGGGSCAEKSARRIAATFTLSMNGERRRFCFTGEVILEALREVCSGRTGRLSVEILLTIYERLLGEVLAEALAGSDPEKTAAALVRIFKKKLLPAAGRYSRKTEKMAVRRLSAGVETYGKIRRMLCRENVGGYRVDTEFRRVLAALAVIREKSLPETMRVAGALKLLLAPLSFFRATFLPHGEQAALLGEILDRLGGSSPKTGTGGRARTVCFRQDAGLICCAFRQAYGIDLGRARLGWGEFSMLVSGAPEGTRLAQVMQIRAMPIPAPSGRNGEEIARLQGLKRMLSLESDGDFAGGLNGLFQTLAGEGEKGK